MNYGTVNCYIGNIRIYRVSPLYICTSHLIYVGDIIMSTTHPSFLFILISTHDECV